MSEITVTIHFANGSTDQHYFKSFMDAEEFCRDRICYTGGYVKRVMIDERAMWDASWDDISKRFAFRR